MTSYAYDALNRQTTATEAVGTAAQRTTRRSTTRWATSQSTTDAIGNWTTYDLRRAEPADGDHRPAGHTARRRPTTRSGDVTDDTDALGKVRPTCTTAAPADRQRPTRWATRRRGPGRGGQAGGDHRPAGRRRAVTALDPLGETGAAWTPTGGYTQTRPTTPTGGRGWSTDADGNETHYVYDALGRQVVSIDPLGNATTTTYDAAGRRHRGDRPRRPDDQYSYDNANRLTARSGRTTRARRSTC